MFLISIYHVFLFNLTNLIHSILFISVLDLHLYQQITACLATLPTTICATFISLTYTYSYYGIAYHTLILTMQPLLQIHNLLYDYFDFIFGVPVQTPYHIVPAIAVI